MPSYEENIYYYPERCGLTVVAELEYSDMNYCYDTRVVWEKDGALYTARDAGCSCPTPFQDYTSVESLERVDLDSLKAEVKSEAGSDYGNPDFSTNSRDFIRKVTAACK